jgi:hypothetical protein
MSFNIEEFKAEHSHRGGIQKPNRFLVTIGSMPGVLTTGDTGGLKDTHRSLEFWCQAVSLPGYQILTHDVKRYVFDTVEKRPFAPNFLQAQLSFIMDNYNEVWDFWNQWMQAILPHEIESGITDTNALTGNRVYHLTYRKDYVVPVEITIFDEIGEKVVAIELREAFPSNINQVQLAWQRNNDYSEFTVFLEYKDWRVIR